VAVPAHPGVDVFRQRQEAGQPQQQPEGRQQRQPQRDKPEAVWFISNNDLASTTTATRQEDQVNLPAGRAKVRRHELQPLLLQIFPRGTFPKPAEPDVSGLRMTCKPVRQLGQQILVNDNYFSLQ
jgi:hypothetical protein